MEGILCLIHKLRQRFLGYKLLGAGNSLASPSLIESPESYPYLPLWLIGASLLIIIWSSLQWFNSSSQPTPQIPYPQNRPYMSIAEIKTDQNLLNQSVTLSHIQISRPIDKRLFWITDGQDHLFVLVDPSVDTTPLEQSQITQTTIPVLRGIIRPVNKETLQKKIGHFIDQEPIQDQAIYLEVNDAPSLETVPLKPIPSSTVQYL